MEKMKELQVPFLRGTAEATTTEWEDVRYGRKFITMAMKSAGRAPGFLGRALEEGGAGEGRPAQRALAAAVDVIRAVDTDVTPLERPSRRSSTVQNLACFIARCEKSDGGGHDVGDATDAKAAASAAAAAAFAVVEQDEGESMPPSLNHTSPLLIPAMAWDFPVFTEACRRSRGMRRLAAARKARSEAECRVVLVEAVEAGLVRGGREARKRRAVEMASL
eukprot:g13293.t1